MPAFKRSPHGTCAKGLILGGFPLFVRLSTQRLPLLLCWLFLPPISVPACHAWLTRTGPHRCNDALAIWGAQERAGTVGFRCAADVPGSDNLDCGGKSLCGRFQAPDASVTLASTDEWVVFAGNSTVRSPTGTKISAAASLQPLTACNGTQSTLTWDGGKKRTSAASCIGNGNDSIAFTVVATPGAAPTTLSVYGGATGAGAMITATLHDGAEVTTFSDRVNVTANDIHQQVTYNVRWELIFAAKTAGATLHVEISAPSAPLPPPPPPSPPPAPLPCPGLMCGSVTKHTGDVDLSSTGSSDWTHYGLGGAADTVNRKCAAGSLIQPLVTAGSSVPFGDCPQTFSWSDGGSPPGTPADAQFGIEQQTPTAIFLGSGGGPAGGFTFTVDVPAVNSTTNIYIYFGACGNLGVLDAMLENLDNGEETGFKYASEMCTHHHLHPPSSAASAVVRASFVLPQLPQPMIA